MQEQKNTIFFEGRAIENGTPPYFLYVQVNHLGNVLATVSDHKIPQETTTGSGIIGYYTADIASSQDYYPFGQLMPGRNFATTNYKFGMNGQEKDDEISGVPGANTTAMYWEYDSRLGRRWNIDPKPDASISNYACFRNNPIAYSDVKGDTTLFFLNKAAASSYGHMFMAYQDDEGGWYMFSMGAAEDRSNVHFISGSNARGGVDIEMLKVQETIKVKDDKGHLIDKVILRNPTKNEVIKYAKTRTDGGYTANSVLVLNTSKKQDKIISENASNIKQEFSEGKQKYNMYFNNCTDVVKQVVQNNTGINMPLYISPSPSSYFDKLMNWVKDFNAQKKIEEKPSVKESNSTNSTK